VLSQRVSITVLRLSVEGGRTRFGYRTKSRAAFSVQAPFFRKFNDFKIPFQKIVIDGSFVFAFIVDKPYAVEAILPTVTANPKSLPDAATSIRPWTLSPKNNRRGPNGCRKRIFL